MLVPKRATQSVVTCGSPVPLNGGNVTCTVTVTDVDPAGTKSSPGGSTTFSENSPTGSFTAGNTCNLARICAQRVPTYHIAEPGCLVSESVIRHRPIGAPSTAVLREDVTNQWLPAGQIRLGLTAGASTPDNIVGQVIERLADLAGRAAS
jgi:hypothetical protein